MYDSFNQDKTYEQDCFYNYFYTVINRNYKTDVKCPIIIILARIDSNIYYKDYFPNFQKLMLS